MKWTSKLFTISLIQCGFIAAIVCLYLLKPPTPLTVTTTTLSNQPAPTSPAPPTSLTAATSPAAPPPTSPGCIITIDGIRYDIKPFIALHQGGDIFQCNTDMSRIFHNQHTPDFLDKLTPYQLKQ